MDSIHILIATNQKILHDGVKLILSGKHNCSTTTIENRNELLSIINKNNYDMLLLDLDIPDLEIPDIIKKISKEHAHTDILALCSTEKSHFVKVVMRSGAAGFIYKRRGKDELLKAIETIQNGNQYLCDETIQSLLQEPKTSASNTDLTERELEILNLICQEYTNREIAEMLHISIRTVDAHRRNLLNKTKAKNTAGLVKYAIKNDLFHF